MWSCCTKTTWTKVICFDSCGLASQLPDLSHFYVLLFHLFMQNTCVYEHFVLAPALPQYWGSVTSSHVLKNERLFRNDRSESKSTYAQPVHSQDSWAHPGCPDSLSLSAETLPPSGAGILRTISSPLVSYGHFRHFFDQWEFPLLVLMLAEPRSSQSKIVHFLKEEQKNTQKQVCPL